MIAKSDLRKMAETYPCGHVEVNFLSTEQLAEFHGMRAELGWSFSRSITRRLLNPGRGVRTAKHVPPPPLEAPEAPTG